uniref:CCHC-type domain-containing protein n=1 Tax=Chromera velia CCMP2878 TaxID=1169474 RepID=A0A0G4FCX1_9ALVE|eukprot:Cvel_16250.t1-p1 / transcript=Cvel_16250.t1 / gene=Cvel_16250 / organism=Chromera_velia_CCMP2878 / gene_product=hypothetical protein / transcript_product=hypothetical protein / location=Cvel_scaffold1243:20375-26705(-) / protein_length=657 / sequence_SO=supercontig / SO=protein_coding / is_pseudo=false
MASSKPPGPIELSSDEESESDRSPPPDSRPVSSRPVVSAPSNGGGGSSQREQGGGQPPRSETGSAAGRDRGEGEGGGVGGSGGAASGLAAGEEGDEELGMSKLSEEEDEDDDEGDEEEEEEDDDDEVQIVHVVPPTRKPPPSQNKGGHIKREQASPPVSGNGPKGLQKMSDVSDSSDDDEDGDEGEEDEGDEEDDESDGDDEDMFEEGDDEDEDEEDSEEGEIILDRGGDVKKIRGGDDLIINQLDKSVNQETAEQLMKHKGHGKLNDALQGALKNLYHTNKETWPKSFKPPQWCDPGPATSRFRGGGSRFVGDARSMQIAARVNELTSKGLLGSSDSADTGDAGSVHESHVERGKRQLKVMFDFPAIRNACISCGSMTHLVCEATLCFKCGEAGHEIGDCQKSTSQIAARDLKFSKIFKADINYMTEANTRRRSRPAPPVTCITCGRNPCRHLRCGWEEGEGGSKRRRGLQEKEEFEIPLGGGGKGRSPPSRWEQREYQPRGAGGGGGVSRSQTGPAAVAHGYGQGHGGGGRNYRGGNPVVLNPYMQQQQQQLGRQHSYGQQQQPYQPQQTQVMQQPVNLHANLQYQQQQQQQMMQQQQMQMQMQMRADQGGAPGMMPLLPAPNGQPVRQVRMAGGTGAGFGPSQGYGGHQYRRYG